MHYAHERNVIHRDLKPSNILMQRAESDGAPADSLADTRVEPAAGSRPAANPKITDFGLARMLDAGQEHTRTGAVLGTPAYMSPEQAAGRGDVVGPRTDIYALGTLLYETLTGRPPFVGESSWDVLVQVIHSEPTRPSKLRPQLSRDLDTICLKALAKHPLDRYANSAALADDLEAFAAGEAISARPEGRLPRLMRRIRKHPVQLAMAIVAIGLLVVATLYSWHVRAETKRGLDEGREFAANGHLAEAAVRLQHAAQYGTSWPVTRDLQRQANREWRGVRRQQIARQLHSLAEQLRFRFDPESLTLHEQQTLAEECRRVWQARDEIMAFAESESSEDWVRAIRADLIDNVLLSSSLSVRLATGAQAQRAAREDALATLLDIESMYGPSIAVSLERRQHEKALGREIDAPVKKRPETAWDYYLLGRTQLLAAQSRAEYVEAGRTLKHAIWLNPKEAVSYFAAGRAAIHAGEYADAKEHFGTCIALATNDRDVCHYNRGLAYFHLQRDQDAMRDFDKAIELNPKFAAAWLNRGLAQYRIGKFDLAATSLTKALELGADPPLVHFNLAAVYEALRD
jgi:serine/threonine-protein kinase